MRPMVLSPLIPTVLFYTSGEETASAKYMAKATGVDKHMICASSQMKKAEASETYVKNT